MPGATISITCVTPPYIAPICIRVTTVISAQSQTIQFTPHRRGPGT